MDLYWIKAQAPRKTLAVAKYLGLDIRTIKVDAASGGLRAADYVALNPNAKAPTLVDGDYRLWEASAIMAYMCEKVGSNLWPVKTPGSVIEVMRWLSWDGQQWGPAVGPFYFEHVVKKTFNIGPPDNALLDSKRKELMRFATILNNHLATRDYVANDQLSIADFSLAAMACHWREADMRFEALTALVAWLDRLDTIPAWADPWPSD